MLFTKKYISLLYGNADWIGGQIGVTIFTIACWFKEGPLRRLNWIKIGKDEATLGGIGFYYIGIKLMPVVLDLYMNTMKAYEGFWIKHYQKQNNDFFTTVRAMDHNPFVPLSLNESYRAIVYGRKII